MKSKIESAITIAKTGVDVFIAKAGTEHAVLASQGKMPQLGTRIHC